jgi:nucleotide-binding universal stress UspA family protein
MYERIIISLDGSELAEKVLPHAEALAEKFGSTLVLLRAVTDEATLAGQAVAVPIGGMIPPSGQYIDVEGIVEAERSEVSRYLEEVAQRLQARGFTVETSMPEGHPAEAIVAQASAQNASLIAMTTHGRSGLSRLFMGSVTDEVLRTAICPVLVVRSGGQGVRAGRQ